MKIICIILSLLFCGSTFAKVEKITVKTRAKENKNAVFYYRIPKNYDETAKRTYRVLVFFGGKNCSGISEANGKLGFSKWADKNDVFIVAPGFRNDNYWEPKEWSGNALLKALNEIKKKYKVCTTKIFYYGYSAGSQASNLFPEWRTGITRAWVSHACGVFHEPKSSMKNIPGLVTCGDADRSRYIISRNFVEEARKKNINIIWKSFPNSPHNVPKGSVDLALAFLTFYNDLYSNDLIYSYGNSYKKIPVKFVGDDSENEFYDVKSPKAKNIFREDLVLLPNQAIADAWLGK